MDWQIMVIGQLSLLLVGTAGACFWHIRKLRATNRSLFEALESQQNGPSADNPPAQSAADDAAPTEEAPAPEAAAQAELDSSAVIEEHPPQAPEVPDATEQVQAPSAPSAPAEAGSDDGAAEMPNPGGDGLKKLLQQFTQDSRDMVTRIEQLERQTQALIDQTKDETNDEASEEANTAGTSEASEPGTEAVNEPVDDEADEADNVKASA